MSWYRDVFDDRVPCGGDLPGPSKGEKFAELTEEAIRASERAKFVTKDSGARVRFESGMQRDVTAGKTQWHRVYDGPMLKRWAELLTRGAEKYPDENGRPNWMKANGEAELQRARESAARHFAQWMNGDTDEDHAAATIFNLNLAEYVKAEMLETF